MNYDYSPDDYYNGESAPDSLARAASLLGILSIISAFSTGIMGIFFGSLGLLLALLSRGRDSMNPKVKSAALTSTIGLCLGLAITVLALVTVLPQMKGRLNDFPLPISPQTESEVFPESPFDDPELDWLLDNGSANI